MPLDIPDLKDSRRKERMAEVRVQRIQIVWRGRAEQAIESVLTGVLQRTD